MKKIVVFLCVFTQLDAYAQLVGTPYIPPAYTPSFRQLSTNGTAIVSAYTCINDFNSGTPFNSIASGVLKVETPVSSVTQSITATVTTTGTYTIAATANGVTFSGSGTFTQTGDQTIQLVATGTPIAWGNNTFTINTTPNCGCVRYTSVTGVYASLNNNLKDFASHNLGADTNLDPKTNVEGNADGSGGTLGYLYQWGRTNDGHQLRNSATVVGPKGTTDPDIAAGKFITNNAGGDWLTPSNNNLWTGLGATKGPNDPCPPGFRVPTKSQWGGICSGSSAARNGGGIYNTWTWTGNGFMVGPLLFLPAVGHRDGVNATVTGVGYFNDLDISFIYWTGTINTNNTQYAWIIDYHIGNNYIRVGQFRNRANGHAVRCISE